MAHSSLSSRTEVKKQLNSKYNVENVKKSFRTQFRDRLKLLRTECINKRRNIISDGKRYVPAPEDEMEKYGLTPTEILQVLEEVEKELRIELSKNECDQYIEDTNSIIMNLLEEVPECLICHEILDENASNAKLCANCTDLLSKEVTNLSAV